MNNDISLKLENVKFLLPRDIFDELFYETLKENSSRSLSGDVNKGFWEESTAKGANSVHDPAPNDEALEKNAEHIVPKPTWADIVKGEPSNFNVKKKGNESFPPLMPSVKFEKPGCKGLSPIMNVQQVGDTSKRSEKKNKGGQLLFGNETMKK